MFKKKRSFIIGLALSTSTIQVANAQDDIHLFIDGGKITGNLRAYQFTRAYDSDNVNDTQAFSFGGKLKVESGSYYGFSGALAYYFANDLGFNNYDNNDQYLNTVLMGNSHNISSLGEAYLQYKNDLFALKAGRQTIDTPWINSSDAVLIPNLYQGYTAAITPVEGLKVEADRILSFKNRTTSSFDRNTVLALSNSKPKFTDDTDGAIALGVTYKSDQINAKAWLYKFYDFADLGYLQAGYTFPTVGNVKPYVDFQYVKETGSGNEVAGSVDSQAYGVKFGINLPEKLGNIYLAYNEVPKNNEAGTSNGNLVSPYTQGYVTDPLFTSGMNYGLVTARAAGHAWQLGGKFNPFGEKLDIVPTISTYHTEPYVAKVQTYTLDVAYHLSDRFKGLTIRNRLGVNHGNPQWGDYTIDNRVMISYVF